MACGLAVRVGRERKSPGWSGNLRAGWNAWFLGGQGWGRSRVGGERACQLELEWGAANPLLCECGLGTHLRETQPPLGRVELTRPPLVACGQMQGLDACSWHLASAPWMLPFLLFSPSTSRFRN